jgi:hypothetical protein
MSKHQFNSKNIGHMKHYQSSLKPNIYLTLKLTNKYKRSNNQVSYKI